MHSKKLQKQVLYKIKIKFYYSIIYTSIQIKVEFTELLID